MLALLSAAWLVCARLRRYSYSEMYKEERDALEEMKKIDESDMKFLYTR